MQDSFEKNIVNACADIVKQFGNVIDPQCLLPVQGRWRQPNIIPQS